MQTTITITGMTCGHCTAAVTKALQSIPGVERAEVSLDPGQAVVTGNADTQAMLAAIKAENYEAQLQ